MNSNSGPLIGGPDIKTLRMRYPTLTMEEAKVCVTGFERAALLQEMASTALFDWLGAHWGGIQYFIFAKGKMAGLSILTLTTRYPPLTMHTFGRPAKGSRWALIELDATQAALVASYMTFHTGSIKTYDNAGNIIRTEVIENVNRWLEKPA
jgi:hypothetical protein